MPGPKSPASPSLFPTQPTQAELEVMSDLKPAQSAPKRRSFFGSVKQKLRAPPKTRRSEAERARMISGADEQPPAYSDVVNPMVNITSDDDPYAFLSTFDTIFVIDDSGSMAGRSWRETEDALRTITPICAAHDIDGIDVYFLNHKSGQTPDPTSGKPGTGYWNIRDVDAVESLFSSVRPWGGTPTGTRLQHLLKPYFELLKRKKDSIEDIKPVNIIVITDGDPSDDVESVLLNYAKKLDSLDAPPYQVGVQFFQVGNDPRARKALQELDDGLGEKVKGGVRDMVDTVAWSETAFGTSTLTGESILKVVLGAVVRRLDRRSGVGA